MQLLRDRCVFAKEEEPSDASRATAVDASLLRSFVDRGRARLIPVGDGLVSVSVKEGSQGDVAKLFCGARSLIVAEQTGEIYARGVNKFCAVDDVPGKDWVGDTALWENCTAYAQRKMAGFVVTLLSTDGVQLRCMSKHSLDGPHVEMAQKVLREQLSTEQRAAIAHALFTEDVTASCECILREQDFHHPVLELPCYDRQLVLFAMQRRRFLQEQALPFAQVQRRAAEWGLPCTQSHQLTSPAALTHALASTHPWRAAYDKFGHPTELAEGLVILFEPHDSRASAWVRPLRLKAKTTAYVTLRSLRSLICGDSRPRVLLYHKALIAWAATQAPSSSSSSYTAAVEYLQSLETQGGVTLVERSFRGAVGDDAAAPAPAPAPPRRQREQKQQRGRLRYRGASVGVGEAYQQLLRVTEQQVCGGTSLTSLGNGCTRSEQPHLSTLLLCGLPGSGKSTLSAALLAALAEGQSRSRFGYGVVLRKDEVTKAVSLRMGITSASSKHKKRRLGAPVHKEVLRRLEAVRLFAAMVPSPVLLLFDACNATPETRRVWREVIAPQSPAPPPSAQTTTTTTTDCRVLYVECSNPEVLAARVGARPTHELLPTAEEGQRALYTVGKRFVPPSRQESFIHIDTATLPLDSAVRRLISDAMLEVGGDQPRARGRPLRVLTYEQLEKDLVRMEDELIHALLGVESSSSALTAFLEHGAVPSKRERTVIAISFDTATTQQLFDVAAEAIAQALASSTQGGAHSPAPTTFSVVSRLASGVRDAFLSRFRQSPPNKASETPLATTATVVAGHTRWLAGWLFRGKSTPSVTRDAVRRALRERLPPSGATASSAHITLLYSPTAARAGVIDFWKESRLQLGERVAVEVEDVLLDRCAVCLSVRLTALQRVHQWSGEATRPLAVDDEKTGNDAVTGAAQRTTESPDEGRVCRPRLHITLGTAQGVKGGYCGSMFAHFEEWEAGNTALEAKKRRNTATRSQDKFANFLQMRLSPSLSFDGTVKDMS